MWTKADEKFLRSLRIKAEDPPQALPRYRVEPGDVEGEYDVVDALRKFKVQHHFGPENFRDPRLAAEDFARQLNEKQVSS